VTSAEPWVAPAPPASPAPTAETPIRRRRRFAGRLSTGHVIMLVAALLAAVLNYSALRARDDTVRVAVAVRDLPAGAPVSLDAVRFTDARVDDDVLATLVGADRAAEIDGSVATGAIAAGEPLRASDLRPASAPEEQRAMSVPVDPERAVAGALRKGDRVDVIEVRDGTASYLVTDAEVLAVPAGDQRGGLGTLSRFSVTLAVDDVTALRLAAALSSGSLDVVRSTGSSAVQEALDPAVDPAAAGPVEGTEGEGAEVAG